MKQHIKNDTCLKNAEESESKKMKKIKKMKKFRKRSCFFGLSMISCDHTVN